MVNMLTSIAWQIRDILDGAEGSHASRVSGIESVIITLESRYSEALTADFIRT